MLTVLLGTDIATRKNRLDTLRGSTSVVFTDTSYDKEKVLTLIGSNSLFGEKPTIILSGVHDLLDEEVIDNLCRTEDTCILVEDVLLAPAKKAFEKRGVPIETFVLAKEPKKEVFNIFAFTDAVAQKKKAQAWALYRNALFSGIDARELHGKVFWITKTLLIASSTSAEASGLHPFVYQKSKKQAELFTTEELQSNLYTLTTLFHDAQFGEKDLEAGLETFLLSHLG